MRTRSGGAAGTDQVVGGATPAGSGATSDFDEAVLQAAVMEFVETVFVSVLDEVLAEAIRESERADMGPSIRRQMQDVVRRVRAEVPEVVKRALAKEL
jgi:hypothetical protein